MKIWYAFVGEYHPEQIKRLEDDMRIKIQDDHLAFCLDQDKEELSEEYNLKFHDASDILMREFFNDKELIFFLDLMYKKELNQLDDSNLFYNRFDKWLDKTKSIFYKNIKFIIENYDNRWKIFSELIREEA